MMIHRPPSTSSAPPSPPRRASHAWLFLVSLSGLLLIDICVASPAAASSSVQYGKTIFSDIPRAEWLARASRNPLLLRDEQAPNFNVAAAEGGSSSQGIPAPAQFSFNDSMVAFATSQSVDWHTGKNPLSLRATTRVKNQAKCGCCWAFSTISALESLWAIAGNPLSAFSEQYVLDCMQQQHPAALQGCQGGDTVTAAYVLTQRQVPLERDYEYLSYDKSTHSCTFSGSVVASASSFLVPGVGAGQAIEDVMAAFVYYHGPLVVSVNAYGSNWQQYKGGVMDDCPTTTSSMLDHGVIIVGYGTTEDTATPYWKIKNSWSPTWGEQGYIRIRRGTNECGVKLYPVGLLVNPQ